MSATRWWTWRCATGRRSGWWTATLTWRRPDTWLRCLGSAPTRIRQRRRWRCRERYLALGIWLLAKPCRPMFRGTMSTGSSVYLKSMIAGALAVLILPSRSMLWPSWQLYECPAGQKTYPMVGILAHLREPSSLDYLPAGVRGGLYWQFYRSG